MSGVFLFGGQYAMIVLMEQFTITIILAVLGLVMGSFAGATVWRLRSRQLVEDKAAGEKVDAKELKRLAPLTAGPLADDRSRCLSCGHQLAWYDLLPLASWLSTGGKCRYCHARIGWFEPLMELGTAGLFVASYLLWPVALTSAAAVLFFGLWLVAAVMLVILFAYDLKWFLLPNVVVFPLMGVGALMAIVGLAQAPDTLGHVYGLLGAVVILSGIYYALWLLSKGQWIGFGDIKLGLALALIVADWRLAFIALFAANFIGCLIVLPGMVAGKITRTTRVPFGPLLIIGTVVALLAGRFILDWYMRALI